MANGIISSDQAQQMLGGGVSPATDDWFAAQGTPGVAAPAGSAGVPPSGADMLGALQTAPGYQFRLGEGLKALERSAASRGTLLTGGTLKGLQRYAQDVASTEYGNRFNQLYGLAQLGQGAVGQQAGLAQNYAGQIGNLYTQQGNAQAAGTIGSANAWQPALGAGGNLAQMYFLSRLFGGGGGSGGGGYASPGGWTGG